VSVSQRVHRGDDHPGDHQRRDLPLRLRRREPVHLLPQRGGRQRQPGVHHGEGGPGGLPPGGPQQAERGR